MTTQSDRYAVACNIAGPDKAASDGAKAWVTWMTNPGWDHDRLVVLIRSRGGRHVQRWTTLSLDCATFGQWLFQLGIRATATTG